MLQNWTSLTKHPTKKKTKHKLSPSKAQIHHKAEPEIESHYNFMHIKSIFMIAIEEFKALESSFSSYRHLPPIPKQSYNSESFASFRSIDSHSHFMGPYIF